MPREAEGLGRPARPAPPRLPGLLGCWFPEEQRPRGILFALVPAPAPASAATGQPLLPLLPEAPPPPGSVLPGDAWWRRQREKRMLPGPLLASRRFAELFFLGKLFQHCKRLSRLTVVQKTPSGRNCFCGLCFLSICCWTQRRCFYESRKWQKFCPPPVVCN